MAKNITLTEVAEKSIREFVRRRIEEIDEELERINSLKDEKRSLQATIEQLDADESNVVVDPNYQPNWTWLQKAKYIIHEAKSPITTREVVDAILSREPGMERKKAISGISSVLSLSKEFATGKNERNEKTFGIGVDPDLLESESESASSEEPVDDLPF